MPTIVGTVPEAGFPLTYGEVDIKGRDMYIGKRKVAVNRGTPALAAAAFHTAIALGRKRPRAYLVGDIGLGDGSRELYAWLSENLAYTEHETIVFHYLQPDVDWQFKILEAANKMPRKPTLIADAGFMYAAKMSGLAEEYDLFTPDLGELAFLADEQAPHPFYTRGFILHEDQKAEDLVKLAYKYGNAARHMLIKGAVDMVASKEGILYKIREPSSESMEAIGGTGDTITGTVAALIASGLPIDKASYRAALINRWAGKLALPTPATPVINIVEKLKTAWEKTRS
ncbi:MAG: NAD(P)H-hydrate dehydratase [Desulfonatronovibrionaceae bacterium]